MHDVTSGIQDFTFTLFYLNTFLQETHTVGIDVTETLWGDTDFELKRKISYYRFCVCSSCWSDCILHCGYSE